LTTLRSKGLGAVGATLPRAYLDPQTSGSPKHGTLEAAWIVPLDPGDRADAGVTAMDEPKTPGVERRVGRAPADHRQPLPRLCPPNFSTIPLTFIGVGGIRKSRAPR
jgi:hypothetical protein